MDCEIEYLEEDEDIVQQCVQTVENPTRDLFHELTDDKLLVEVTKTPARFLERSITKHDIEKPKRKKKKDEEDSDYDPTDEFRQRFVQRNRKRRSTNTPRPNISIKIPKLEPTIVTERSVTAVNKTDLKLRRQLDIRVPDYEDPLCLPVRAVKNDEYDLKKLRIWNNLCLKHYSYHDVPLRLDLTESVSSSRTVVLRNLQNKQTDRIETTMWSKITIEDKKGTKKSEIVQSVLPRYREKKLLHSVVLGAKRSKPVYNKEEVILTKELDKDEEMLIVYKPKQALSMSYKMFEKKGDNENSNKNEEEAKKYLREMVVCKMCAPCYQTSWRGQRTNGTTSIKCNICGRMCVSVYNLLSHIRSHKDTDVRKHKGAISRLLSEAVQYHYECRICQEKHNSIKALRRHVKIHKGPEVFLCEVGDHMVS